MWGQVQASRVCGVGCFLRCMRVIVHAHKPGLWSATGAQGWMGSCAGNALCKREHALSWHCHVAKLNIGWLA